RPHFQNNLDYPALLVPGGFLGGGGGGVGGVDGIDAGGSDATDVDGFDGGVDSDAGDGGSMPLMGLLTPLQPKYGFQATPRFFLGVRNEDGLGVRSRFWWLDADSELFSEDLTGISVYQSLEMRAFDFELTQIGCFGNLEME